MKQIVFVAVDDEDVDLLSRIRQHDDMRVEAVYHPDPGSLVARIAALSRLPVVSDRGHLAGMTPDVCIGGDRAAELALEWRERALLAGRPAPVFVSVDRVGEYLDDVQGFLLRQQRELGGLDEPAAPPDEAAHDFEAGHTAAGGLEASGFEASGLEAMEFEVTSLAAGPAPVEEPAPAPAAPVTGASPAAPPTAVPPPPAPPATREPEALAPPPRPREPEVTAAPRGPAPPREAEPRTPPPRPREPEVTAAPRVPATLAPPPAAPPVVEEPAESLSLGAPSIDICYEPAQLVAWLTSAAARVLGGSAAVAWQRDGQGERFTLLGYAPSTLALPALPTPPRLLEELSRAGRPQVVSSARLFAGAEMLVPLSLVTVPLPGATGLFGLLGVFRPDTLGPVPAGGLEELARRAPELGQALERCYRFAEMGQELKRLRYRDRLRDLMVGPRFSAPGRWEELLALLLEAAPAAAAYIYRLDPVSARLELTAVGGDEEMSTGRFSVPLGRGFIGSAFQREGVTVYSRDGLDDLNDAHDLYLMPFRARRSGLDVPVALLLLDGVASRTRMGQDTTAFLEELAGIVGPFLE